MSSWLNRKASDLYQLFYNSTAGCQNTSFCIRQREFEYGQGNNVIIGYILYLSVAGAGMSQGLKVQATQAVTFHTYIRYS